MNIKIICLLSILFSSIVFSQESHVVLINKFKDKTNRKIASLIVEANRLDDGFYSLGYVARQTSLIRSSATNIYNSSYWKNLSSRETRKYRQAMYEIDREIGDINVLVYGINKTLKDLQISKNLINNSGSNIQNSDAQYAAESAQLAAEQAKAKADSTARRQVILEEDNGALRREINRLKR
jgi:hypothetical protein